ncbi:MAG: DUF2608 domain-containing protein [Holosporaceae bacterium]|jgi:hypothetical protein|nr:DUF2608 domain-containing protein [Holosporaceae bacterium]
MEMRKLMNLHKLDFLLVFCILLFSNVIFAVDSCDFKLHEGHISTTCKDWVQVDEIIAQLNDKKLFGDFPVALIDYDETISFNDISGTIAPHAAECIKKFTTYGFSNFIITTGSATIHTDRKLLLTKVKLNSHISFNEELFNTAEFNKHGIAVPLLWSTDSKYICEYLDGFLYCLQRKSRNAKGEVFSNLLQCFKKKPTYVILIDDMYYNLCSVAESCKAVNIPFYTIRLDLNEATLSKNTPNNSNIELDKLKLYPAWNFSMKCVRYLRYLQILSPKNFRLKDLINTINCTGYVEVQQKQKCSHDGLNDQGDPEQTAIETSEGNV